MTEADWLACKRPKAMLRYLLGTDDYRVEGIESFPACKGSDRKLRLFACACYHRIHHLLANGTAQAAVQVAERFADGMATAEELQHTQAHILAHGWGPSEALEGQWRASQDEEHGDMLVLHGPLALGFQVVLASAPKAAYYASSNAYLTYAAVTNPDPASWDSAFLVSRVAEEKVQADILRCLFGNPFRRVAIDPGWLRWNDATVPKVAQAIYDDRAFDRLPILADALEEAGCANAEMLRHCRGPGPHARGCWVVDLVLGKG
jgi:hypothetical protein